MVNMFVQLCAHASYYRVHLQNHVMSLILKQPLTLA